MKSLFGGCYYSKLHLSDIKMLTVRSFAIVVQFFALGINTKHFFSIDDEHIERNCLKSVFDEHVRPLLASTNSNGEIFVNLASSESIEQDQDYILKMFHQEFAVIVNSWVHSKKYQNIDSKVAVYVLFCTSLPEVKDTIERWKSSIDTWNSNANVFIFLKDPSESYWKIRKILKILIHSNLLNVNVISIGIRKIEVVTWVPHIDGGCGRYFRNLQIISECILETSRYRVTHNELEELKNVLNVHQMCPLKVISLEWTPFTFFDRKLGSYAGFEAEILKNIADKLQIKPIMIEVSNNSIENIKKLLRNG